MPSVMATISFMPASADSMMASAANGGGTKIIEVLAPVFSAASRTELKTGKPSTSVPPLPGVTPPTRTGSLRPHSSVAYLRHCWEWNRPALPVIPCVMIRVLLSTRMLIVSLLYLVNVCDRVWRGDLRR